MQIHLNDITINRRVLIHSAEICLPEKKIITICGNKGTGKILLLKQLYFNLLEMKISCSYVEQSSSMLIKKFSVLENIALSAETADLLRARQLLAKMNSAYLAEHLITELSGGEQRIISLLRGVMHAGSFLLIDEPTNDLDYQATDRLKQILIEEKKNRTVIIVTHDERIKAIADEIVAVDHCRLIQNKKTDGNSETARVKIQQPDIQGNFIRKGLNSDLGKKIIVTLVVILLGYYLNIYAQGCTVKINPVTENEVDIMIPISEYSMDSIIDGAIPIAAVKCFTSGLSMSEINKLFEESLKQAESMPVNYGLQLAPSSSYAVFELEYYIPFSREYRYTMDVYSALFCGGEEVDTSEWFCAFVSKLDSAAVYKFDPGKFPAAEEKTKAEISQAGPAECTYIAVHITQGDFYDFINSAAFQELTHGNYYIRSNETIDLVNQALSFQFYDRALMQAIIIALSSAAVLAVFDILLMHSNRKALLLFRDAGLSSDTLRSAALSKYDDRYSSVIIILYWIFSYFLFSRTGLQNQIASVIIVAIPSAGLIGSTVIRKLIVKKACKKICDWRTR